MLTEDSGGREYGAVNFLQQGVTISGMSDPAFQQCVANIASIDNMFSRQFKEGTWERWAPSKHEETGLITVDISNRLFTPTKYADDIDSIPIPAKIDPDGVLQQEVASGRSKYLDDNRVQYYEQRGR